MTKPKFIPSKAYKKWEAQALASLIHQLQARKATGHRYPIDQPMWVKAYIVYSGNEPDLSNALEAWPTFFREPESSQTTSSFGPGMGAGSGTYPRFGAVTAPRPPLEPPSGSTRSLRRTLYGNGSDDAQGGSVT